MQKEIYRVSTKKALLKRGKLKITKGHAQAIKLIWIKIEFKFTITDMIHNLFKVLITLNF